MAMTPERRPFLPAWAADFLHALIPRRAAGGVSFREMGEAEVAIQTSHLASVSSSWNEALEFVLTTE